MVTFAVIVNKLAEQRSVRLPSWNAPSPHRFFDHRQVRQSHKTAHWLDHLVQLIDSRLRHRHPVASILARSSYNQKRHQNDPHPA